MNSLKRHQALLERSPNKSGSKNEKVRKVIGPKKTIPFVFGQENYNSLLDDKHSSIFMDQNLGNNLEVYKLATMLNLDSWTRYTVGTVCRDPRTFDLILNLSDKGENLVLAVGRKAVCRLQGVWANTNVESGDVVSLRAVWSNPFNCFVVNADAGAIVINPDHLISGTMVVGSLFCIRKSVLQEKFGGIDHNNKVMIIGSIIHELFQIVLRRKLITTEQIQNASQELLNSRKIMFLLYGNRMTLKETESELQKFVTNIAIFVERYITGDKKTTVGRNDFSGSIDSIQDIEENIWAPQLGLKGKIDVSVHVRSRENRINSGLRYMPLELKTGRATFSSEHKGQLILYQMMLTELGRDVESGLLLYLRDGIMKEVRATKNEQRDIIILRNELSYHLTRNVKSKSGVENIDGLPSKYKSFELPEPINRHSACSKCPYNTICCVYLSEENSAYLPEHNPLKRVSQECMAHLQSSDITYFTHWCGLLALEDQHIKQSNPMKRLWITSPEHRRKMGQAITNLKVVGKISYSEGTFIHTFEMMEASILSPPGNVQDFTLTGLSTGDYVIVSSKTRIAIASGTVYGITKIAISIGLERNLSDNYHDEIFIIDNHESQSRNSFNYTNLGVLMDNREECNQLRKIIINKIKPTFSKVLPKIIAIEGANILKKLNQVQRKAVLKALTANEYLLLKGLPGTGKTQTLIAVIQLLHLMKKSVIVTSHTHSAVDNILERLKAHNIEFLRLGSDTRIVQSLHEYSETKLTTNCLNLEDLSRLYASYNVVGVTCHGAAHSLFLHRNFDVCIVDEATQVLQPTILRPLFHARKFILVGDPDQLRPVVKSKLGRNIGASESLFARLDHPDATVVLTHQYRMNKTITKLANEFTYKGDLICADDETIFGSMNLPNMDKLLSEYPTRKWLLRALEKHIDQSVIVLDTKNCRQRSVDFEHSRSNELSQVIERTFIEETGSPKKSSKLNYTNYCDAAIAFAIMKCLIIGGYSCNNIGIIAPYTAQVELLRKIMKGIQNFYCDNSSETINFQDLEVNTVDQYQGRDKEIIIYSCTRTGNLNNVKSSVRDTEILEDRRRLTVAITRAKYKFIIIGDEQCLKEYTPFRDLLEKIPSRCKISLEDGVLGFSWNEVFCELDKFLVV